MVRKATTKSGPKAAQAPESAEDAKSVSPKPQSADSAVQDNAARSASLKLRELVNRVAEATGGKKKGVKEVVEATLDALGQALAKGEELNLPGVGKVRVAKSSDRQGRAMMTLKLRGTGAGKKKEPKEALAEGDEAV